jgi:hypothetical protein
VLAQNSEGSRNSRDFRRFCPKFHTGIAADLTKSSLSIRPTRKSMTPLILGPLPEHVADAPAWCIGPRRRSRQESGRRCHRFAGKEGVLGSTATTAPAQRNLSIRSLNEHGRMNWRTTSGYHRRSKGEAAIGRSKRVIGDALYT